MEKKRIVVTGAAGQLGHALAMHPDALPAVFATRGDLPLVAAETSPLLDGVGIIINAAAYTLVDAAESHPDAAWEVNTAGPAALARRAQREKAHLIHVSTDYVFGQVPAREPLRPCDPPRPVSVYGQTKLEGEIPVLAGGGTVIRTAWVYSGNLLPEHKDFVSTMLRLAAGEAPVRVVDDQIGSPTFVGDLAGAIWHEARALRPGIFHATGAGRASWADVARAVFEEAGYDPNRVERITTAEYPTPAQRPAWSVLHSDYALPQWRDGIARAVAGRL
ncbi:dTDP-4-dehydrorhamnose reductase [Corynebacterium renale]|uniref:dTDP-4-dehydrorhamnose reductase n=1 Tax=Corynebacterium renale TaxID=1724 RepID=UPI000DF978A5|nr:dTDP-4-dehydrorhamnose reductase [Corynebacterium renale]STC94477.1 dTDP-4-dehydrorhamnose reductase [Corynebacterium renale]